MRLLWLGFVFLAAIFLFAVGILMVENLSIFAKPETIHIGFERVQGLRKGDDVRVEGVPYGKVIGIELHPEGVLVTARVEERIDLYGDPSGPDGYKIFVESFSILGGNQISIQRGKPSAGPPKAMRNITVGDVAVPVYAGRVRPEALTELGAVVADNRDALKQTIEGARDTFTKAGATLEKVGGAMDEAKSVLEKINRGEGTIGKLITDDQIYKDIRDITGKINRGEGTIGRLLNEETLYKDLTDITGQVKSGKGVVSRLLYDEELGDNLSATVKSLNETVADLREIVKGVREGKGVVGKLFKDFNQEGQEDLYDTAKKSLEGIDKTLGRVARATGYIGADWRSFAETDSSIARIYVRFEPDDTKYFQAGAAFLSYLEDGDTIVFEDQVEQGEDQTFIKPEIFLAYKIPWILDNHLTLRAGLLEGKPGGAIDFHWEDFGLFQHPVDVTVEIRDAYNDLDDEDIDENVDGPMARILLKTPLYPESDGWFGKILHSFKLTAGFSRLQDDPEFFFGVGLEYVEEDIRTLLGLIGAGT